MSDLQKIKDLIDSDEESNWILAVELARLLDRESKFEVLKALVDKDTELHLERMMSYARMGMIVYNPYNQSLHDNSIITDLITNFKNIMNGKNNNT